MQRTILVTDRGAYVRDWLEADGYVIDLVYRIRDFNHMLNAGAFGPDDVIIGDLPFSTACALSELGTEYQHVQLKITEYRVNSFTALPKGR